MRAKSFVRPKGDMRAITRRSMSDKKKPKPRKHPILYQTYSWWDELTRMKQRHMLRIGAVERGDSQLDADFERNMMSGMCLDTFIAQAEKEMLYWGKATGPIWDWMTSIKGMYSTPYRLRNVVST